MNWIEVSIQLLGGLAIFLYGMHVASEGLRKSSSYQLNLFLQKVTKNQWYGALAGIVLAAILQSSTAATVMIIGFVNAGLISLRRAMGVLLGSAVGTTLTVQLIAFAITDYALVFVILGMLFFLFDSNLRSYGSIVLGFGFVFYGLGLMTGAMEPLQSSEWFRESLVLIAEYPLLFVLVAAVFTGIIQNSAATIALTLALTSSGLISLEAAVYTVYGANLGTVVTAMIASLKASKDAQRAAIAHAIFKAIGVLVFLPFTSLFVQALPLLGGDVERQIANAHTIFNIVNMLLLLPFCNRFADWMVQLLPEKPEPAKDVNYIDRDSVQFPSVGLLQARKELERAAGKIRNHMLPYMISMIQDEKIREAVVAEEKIIDHLYKAIYHHLQRLMEQNLNDRESEEALKLLYFNNDMERMANTVKDMTRTIAKLDHGGKRLSEWERAKVTELYEEVMKSFDDAIQGFRDQDEEVAIRVIHSNPKILRLERELRYQHFYQGASASSTVSVVFSDLMTSMLRIHQHSVNISHTLLGMV
ncbi:Na/Pi cotransporter family protein [Salicibibacter cibi]|uniref:Na/Pi cotransporter family protein n=1 Tax=Salicibibacter cibi TaxID=2743001 RepID=A0A7T6ZCN1_9BACI|nr:Na/Pi cotransporter family protein [Salicibibacter cibi]QQK81061.1 Na/Pi cotransporter family protein [Salicibibacter cibi]